MEFLRTFWNWAEVWALFIPLFVLFFRPQQPRLLSPIIAYLFLALLLNLLIDISWLYRAHVPSWLDSNNYLYNIHSVVRLLCFSILFIGLPQLFLKTLNKLLACLSLLFITINFLFFEDFFRYDSFSSRLFAVESAILLFYCMQYYLYKFQEESSSKWTGDFWVVTGLSIYVVFNFPYFLFYTTLIARNMDFAEVMWNLHNACFLILCTFIARALYVSRH